ncbi:hypothetical protein BCR43DRAFT_524582 [Syncephalastrum racemosum]|uniref:Uncharacterized protein n=1 Tax=Syncephalastrum racemosum TaxID=13706 RepID=A0A1X2HCI0_SYNRA|nr:hypothetical protein BCR43DRAFT_524582 [Syncephalastrum racemosum]
MALAVSSSAVVDFLQFATIHRPSDWQNYVQIGVTAEDLFAIVGEHVPGASPQICQWLSADTQSDKGPRLRKPDSFIKWFSPSLDHAKHGHFNHAAYRESVRQQQEWITVGYARKSKPNDAAESHCKCLQRRVNTLHSKDLCRHVFVSTYSDATSELRTRDVTLSSP